MDRILSARIDERAFQELERATRRMRITKKKFLEEAIRQHASSTDSSVLDVWAETRGAWKRSDSPGETVRKVRRRFERAMHRHAR